MSSTHYVQIEKFLEEKMTEFNEKRVKAAQKLTLDDILDINPISFVLRSKYSLAEITNLLVDRKLMAIEQNLLVELVSDLSELIGKEISVTEAELQTILQHIIHDANVFEGIDIEFGRLTGMVVMKLLECRDKTSVYNWVKLANLSSSKFGLEKITGTS
jgi:hypothetical protein